jgi:Dyp-type peroxidase family
VGLAERSALLGDPRDGRARGNPGNWLLGGTPATTPDLVVIAASDEAEAREAEVAAVLRGADGCSALRVERGDNPSGAMAGHEHFGFRDGISQPAVRGLGISPRPGQAHIWPGQIVLGYPTQDRTDPDVPREAPLPGPAWCRDGAFVVIRRLRQDVAGFWSAVASRAARLRMDPVRLAACLVGRWPSGAPLVLAPNADDPALAADPARVNDFRYAAQDPAGIACPHAAHIRKVNPRDVATEQGSDNDTLARLFLRRGIPYGPALADPTAARRDDGVDRGLMFVAFMASIVDQFEFFPKFWLNAADGPERAGAGHDPLIGQEEDRRGGRTRRFELPGVDGARPVTLRFARDFVTPTGGGYFFAPSLIALREVLGG